MERVNEYRTKDIYIASVLAVNQSPVNLQPESNFYWFVFNNPERCEQIVDDFWQNKLQVNAKDLVTAIKDLKTRVFTERRQSSSWSDEPHANY